MHRALIAAAVAVALAACDGFDAPPATPPAASASPAQASDAGSPATLSLATAVKDRALEVAKTCVIHAPNFDDAIDECSYEHPAAGALGEAVAALERHEKEHPDEVRGAADAFATTARLFAEWVARADELRPVRGASPSIGNGAQNPSQATRGTLRLFQDFADAWNRFQPSQPIPVDPVEEYRAYGFGSKGYVMRPIKKTNGRLAWLRCLDGPCMSENPW